jgi:formylglycine-generating enzyme required for sulfatase activity/uncharacterized caspase-like protein
VPARLTPTRIPTLAAILTLAALTLATLLPAQPAGAAPDPNRRVALVIGNGAYRHAPELPNPTNDARAVARALEGLGFDVALALDTDYRALRRALRDFARRLSDAGVGLFYYAGHGLQVEGKNYLVPVDARLEAAADVDFELLAVRKVLNQLERQQRTSLVFLDACRDNPLARSLQRSLGTRSGSVGRGLTPMRSGLGTLIAFATAPGYTAADGVGKHSPFTSALLAHLDTRGLEVGRMLRKVRADVIRVTSGRQIPWDHSSLVGDFYFKPGRPQGPSPQVGRLLRECAAHLAANRLTTGAGGTALACYRDVLALDRGNAQALAGLDTIAERYLGWAEDALDRGDKTSARTYLARLNKVSPEHPRLAQLRQRLDGGPAPGPQPPPEPVPGPTPPPPAARTWTEPTTGMRFVRVDGDCFQMGSPASEDGRDSDERQHRVCVDDFALAAHEVTNRQYRLFERNHDSKDYEGHSLNGDEQPAVYVSWEEATAYAEWLSERTGKRFRLPTEAQWEYAARAGSTSARFWGQTPEQACRYANVADKTAKREWSNWTIHDCDDGHKVTSPVGTYDANPWGLYDMLGNVWEWTCSAYESDYDGSEKRCVSKKHTGPRVLRGGSWDINPAWVRSASRFWLSPGIRNTGLGFRLAQDL